MVIFQEHVKIYAIYANNEKIFIICPENSIGNDTVEKYAKFCGNQKPIVTSYEHIYKDGNYIYFSHKYEPGIKCESDNMIWDCFDGNVPKRIYLYDEMELVYERCWKELLCSEETEIEDGFDIVRYTYVDSIESSK